VYSFAFSLPGLLLRLTRMAAMAFALTLVSSSASAQTALSESQLKASLVLNFARYVEWPESAFASAVEPLQICLLGRDTLGGALTALESRQVNNRPVRVKIAMTSDEVRSCHVVFVSDSEERRIVPLLRSLAERPILTVSDMGGFVEFGGAIGIVQGDTRLQFDVNRRALEQVKLKASSQLLKLARTLSDSSGKN
jgi:YfiR/HmsC-like